MCGFSGIYAAGDGGLTEYEIGLVEAGRSRLTHRGPDENGFFKDCRYAVGFNRLSITVLDGGHQPYVSEGSRYVTVFNGEIYNYRELSSEYLGGTASSEVEVITGLYSLMGDRSFRLLRGMFAIVIYDSLGRELVAARDLFGIKPLYYARIGDSFLFASELAGLPVPEGTRPVSREAVNRYCAFGYVPGPGTIYEDVATLPGGHCARFTSGGVKISEFSKKGFSKPVYKRGYAMRERLRDTLEECVGRYMDAEVAVGTFLSGGIDSSIVTALASKINPSVKAFTIGFANKDYPSEAELARRTAEHLGVELVCGHFDAADFVEAFEPTLRHLGTPMADPSVIGVYLVSKTAAAHVKVALSGEGADELFGGYKVYRSTAWTGRLGKAQDAADFCLRLVSRPLSKNSLLRQCVKERCFRLDKHFIGPTFIMGDKDRVRYLAPAVCSARNHREVTRPYLGIRGMSRLQRMQMCDWNLWLPYDILHKGDMLSMAHSLEVRIPFLDTEVYHIARQLRAEDKVSISRSKILLREAFADLLPSDVVSRPKLGFPVPVASWLKDELYDWGRAILECDAAGAFIDSRRAVELYDRYRKGTVPDFSFRTIWLLIVLAAWCRYQASDARGH